MQLSDCGPLFVGRLLHQEVVGVDLSGFLMGSVIGGVFHGQFHRKRINKSNVLELRLSDYRSTRMLGFVA